MSDLVKSYFQSLQTHIIKGLEKEETNGHFIEDPWSYESGTGGGLSCVLENGDTFEKAGVNFSSVSNDQMPEAVVKMKPELEGYAFQAMGVSLVIHPLNPFVPSAHANVRYLCAQKEGCETKWWFGGGFDLTPYYGFKEDCIFWHQMARQACQPFGDDVYPRYKKQCDDYFYIPFRNETRGIGGLFYDYLNEWSFETCFAFTQSVGDHFIEAYQPIVAKRKSTPFDNDQREWQLHRRARYAEFNLALDRGTRFGLQSNGRTESVLMSLPPLAKWRYNYHPAPDTEEEKLIKEFLKPVDWLHIES
jgi:coproporphyrinogen III oxidase